MTIDPRIYFQISASSGVPIYRQIMDQVRIHAAAGRLSEDVFLPSVRQVAKQLAVNPMTVSKAYSLLEKEGTLENVRGQGMRLTDSGTGSGVFEMSEKEMAPLLREVVIKARQLSVDQDRLMRWIQKIWKE